MPTTIPAVVRASTLRALLRRALGADAELPGHYTVSAIGVYDHTTGIQTDCDTAAFYTATGAAPGENITIDGSPRIGITRYRDIDGHH